MISSIKLRFDKYCTSRKSEGGSGESEVNYRKYGVSKVLCEVSLGER